MTLRFTLRQLEYLVAVADCGSVALAAERVNVSSPSISAAIGQLGGDLWPAALHPPPCPGPVADRRRAPVRRRPRARFWPGRPPDRPCRRHHGSRGRAVDRGLPADLCPGPAAATAPQLFRPLPRCRLSASTRAHQAELFDGLRMARLDVALTYDLEIPPDLDFLPLIPLAPYALLPEGHPLGRRAQRHPRRPCPASDDPAGPALQRRLFPVVLCRGRSAPGDCRTDARHGGDAGDGGQWLWLFHRQHPAWEPTARPMAASWSLCRWKGGVRPMQIGPVAAEGQRPSPHRHRPLSTIAAPPSPTRRCPASTTPT